MELPSVAATSALGFYADPDHPEPPSDPQRCTVVDARFLRTSHPPLVTAKPIPTKIVTLLKPFASAKYRDEGLNEYEAHRAPHTSTVTWGVRSGRTVLACYSVPRWFGESELRCFKQMHALGHVHPGAAAFSVSAALLLGVPLPRGTEVSTLHVVTAPGSNPIERRDTTHHRSQLYVPRDWHGLPVVPHQFALASVAGVLKHDQLVAAIDAVCGAWNFGPYLTVDGLTRSLDDAPPFHGKALLRKALRSARNGVGSPRETAYRLAFVSAGLPEPEVTPAVDIPGLPVPIHPDMVWREKKVAFEYDGAHHDYDRGQNHYDKKVRYPAMWKAGWTVVIATKEDRISDKVAEVARALADC